MPADLAPGFPFPKCECPDGAPAQWIVEGCRCCYECVADALNQYDTTYVAGHDRSCDATTGCTTRCPVAVD